MFLTTYQNSHNNYLTWQYKINWKDLKNYGFSYAIHFENIKKNNLNDTSYLMIKNISKAKLENIKINVEVENDFEKYIQNIFISNIVKKTKPIKVILNQMPFQELEFYNGNILRKYKAISIKLIELNNKVINEEFYKGYPTYTTFLNDKWDYKWGFNWNLKQIEDGKTNLKHYIYGKLVNGNIMDIDIYHVNYKNPIKFFKSIIYQVLTSKFILNSIFWILIWNNIIIEDKNNDLTIKRQQNTGEK